MKRICKYQSCTYVRVSGTCLKVYVRNRNVTRGSRRSPQLLGMNTNQLDSTDAYWAGVNELPAGERWITVENPLSDVLHPLVLPLPPLYLALEMNDIVYADYGSVFTQHHYARDHYARDAVAGWSRVTFWVPFKIGTLFEWFGRAGSAGF